jgi:hypothetical protein
MSTAVHCCPNRVVVTTVVNCRRGRSSELCMMWFSNFSNNYEPTSGLEPLTWKLRVCGQALLRVAGVCISCISKPVSILRVAVCCIVLRSRWCQCGVRSRWMSPLRSVWVQVGITEVGIAQVSFAQVGIAQVSLAQVGTAQVSLA